MKRQTPKCIDSLYNSSHIHILQRLKASYHYTVGNICEEKGKELELEVDKTVIACIAKLGLQQLETFAGDLEAFARYCRVTER